MKILLPLPILSSPNMGPISDQASVMVEGFRALVVYARRTAQIDHTSNVTVAAGLENLRADGATDLELEQYILARSLCTLQQVAKGSGINVVILSGGGKETTH